MQPRLCASTSLPTTAFTPTRTMQRCLLGLGGGGAITCYRTQLSISCNQPLPKGGRVFPLHCCTVWYVQKECCRTARSSQRQSPQNEFRRQFILRDGSDVELIFHSPLVPSVQCDQEPFSSCSDVLLCVVSFTLCSAVFFFLPKSTDTLSRPKTARLNSRYVLRAPIFPWMSRETQEAHCTHPMFATVLVHQHYQNVRVGVENKHRV